MKNPIKIVPGFRFSGIHCGIKERRKKDLALIVADRPAKAVACFTKNRVQAAPVLQGKDVIRKGKLHAIVINSGNANAVTGKQGLKNAYRTAKEAAKCLGAVPEQVLISSTGKIGVPLDMKPIFEGLPRAVGRLSSQGWREAAEAIKTTDAFVKVASRQGKVGNKMFTLTGIAKGAGMIEPNMATMLAYVLTDVDLPLPLMRSGFRKIVDQTFNAVTVDGDTSTNDTALLWANGLSGIRFSSKRSRGFAGFHKLLGEVCQDLAYQMVLDGEGATKVVGIEISGASSDASARKMAYAIANSQLVKTSFFGEDPNWGRVFAAIGYSGETFDPQRVDISYGPVPLVRGGMPTSLSNEAKAHKLMKKEHFSIIVDLKQGRGTARLLTSDLGYEYVKINAEYRT
ncbi:MAG: bifunctional glutamate N-acetyltransferase/amino-acid acetyltransferase ArgJ [bacterium]|nr:bifunctional glutamate N-acetyltransferase/amino-acid acetyltransferase ArgJ [bacterium]